MDMTNVESLLSELVSVNRDLLSEVQDLRTEISKIGEELNWVGKNTYAQVVYESLNSIDSRLADIETNTST